MAADSTARCSAFAKHLNWCVEGQRIAGPLVQLSRNRVELNLEKTADLYALEHVLPEQSIGDLVAFSVDGSELSSKSGAIQELGELRETY